MKRSPGGSRFGKVRGRYTAPTDIRQGGNTHLDFLVGGIGGGSATTSTSAMIGSGETGGRCGDLAGLSATAAWAPPPLEEILQQPDTLCRDLSLPSPWQWAHDTSSIPNTWNLTVLAKQSYIIRFQWHTWPASCGSCIHFMVKYDYHIMVILCTKFYWRNVLNEPSFRF